MGKSITVRCTICGSQKSTFIPNKYGESGNRSEDQFVAGCNKCSEKRLTETVQHRPSGSSGGGGGGGDGGCLGPLAMLALFVFFMVCCCGGLGGKS